MNARLWVRNIFPPFELAGVGGARKLPPAADGWVEETGLVGSTNPPAEGSTPLGNSTSTKSTFNFFSVLTPINRGEPRLATTISLGKWTALLKTNAKEP